MTITYSENIPNANSKIKWSRDDVSQKVIDFENHKLKFSQRDFAKEKGVPRTTLQNWLNRKTQIDADPEVVDSLESPVGVNFLHNLTLSLHFEFTKVGCASIRNIFNFLELTKLSRFVAPCLRHPSKDIGSNGHYDR